MITRFYSSNKALQISLFYLMITRLATSLIAEDWLGFRGSRGDGVSTDTSVPHRLDSQSILWSVNLPGRGLSSPVIVGDRLFVTASSGARLDRLHVLCFNISDGSLRWERQFWATGRTMTHEKISPAAPTPVSDGKTLFALFSSNDCIALDLEGNLLWFRGLGRDYVNASNSLGMSSSLVFADGVLVTQVENDSESFTAGLDAQTGLNRWKLDRPKRANWTSPTVYRERSGQVRILLQSFQGVTAVDPASGRILWNYSEGASTVPSAIWSDGRLYLPSNGLTVLELSPDGSVPKQVWRSAQLRPGTPSPVVLGGRVYSLNDGGILTCGDGSDGKRLWQLRIKGPFSATPISAGGRLYCVNEVGLVQVVDPSQNEGTVTSELALGQTVIGTPSISTGSLFVRSDGMLWRIGTPSTR
ncbi:MAG: pyrrolo-quinoline quinone [Pedosphaera sp.]|nr:pyrrolo-quinoline quinone [Pedosphaera sp.]